MVLHVHDYPTSPTFASCNVSNKVANRSNGSYKGVSVKDIGSIIDHLHVGPSKCVRFSDEPPQVVQVDYPSVDTNDLWYSRAQLYIVQADTKKCLEQIDPQLHESEVDIGLERWAKRGALNFQQHLEATYSVVLLAGEDSSVHVIAAAYADVGIYSKMVANTRGMKLEREIRQCSALEKKNLAGTDQAFSFRSRRRRSSSSKIDLFSYRRGSSRCRVALDEVNTALTTVRKLGLHNMPKSYLE